MASRSLFIALRQRSSSRSRFRFSSSGAASSESAEESSHNPEGDDLKSRIFRLRLPKRSATNVIQKWVGEGNQASISELRQISKDLRKSQRYKHALEVSEWMVSREKFKISDSDYATRIDLMTKVFGIDAAARYFEGLADSAKTTETYTALLHSYAGAKLTEKAELLYEKMKGSKLPLTALTYNEMMTLYISVGQVDKIPLVVEELKRQNVTPDIFTYNLWISSCASVLNINEVRRILDEMNICSGSDGCWTAYINLVKIYIDVNRLENADSSSPVEADNGITQREWITYDFLVIVYAALGNKGKVDQIWKSLRMTKQKMTSRNFLCILSSFLILGHLNEVEEVIDQWKQSTVTEFDPSACNRLLAVFADLGLSKNANDFEKLLIERNCSLPGQS